MTDELKPCPFCGSKAEQWTGDVDIGGGDYQNIFWCGCRNQHCTIQPKASVRGTRGYSHPDDTPDEVAELRALKAWNDRALLSASIADTAGAKPVAFPAIKGAWIDGGYVIVTPAGTGNAPALKEAILKAAAPQAECADQDRIDAERYRAKRRQSIAMGITASNETYDEDADEIVRASK